MIAGGAPVCPGDTIFTGHVVLVLASVADGGDIMELSMPSGVDWSFR